MQLANKIQLTELSMYDRWIHWIRQLLHMLNIFIEIANLYKYIKALNAYCVFLYRSLRQLDLMRVSYLAWST